MQIHFLGDIHGSWGTLNTILSRYRDNRIIQVGDLGLGFGPELSRTESGLIVPRAAVDGSIRAVDEPPDPPHGQWPERFKFIRGNHDNPRTCLEHPNYLGHYGVDPQTGIFFLGGGYSIDREMRTVGIDWWDDEELSQPELQAAIDLYVEAKPSVVVTHEPLHAVHQMLVSHRRTCPPSRTCHALQMMFELHRPLLWIFGHHHIVWRGQGDPTLFVCAAINQVVTFEV